MKVGAELMKPFYVRSLCLFKNCGTTKHLAAKNIGLMMTNVK